MRHGSGARGALLRRGASLRQRDQVANVPAEPDAQASLQHPDLVRPLPRGLQVPCLRARSWGFRLPGQRKAPEPNRRPRGPFAVAAALRCGMPVGRVVRLAGPTTFTGPPRRQVLHAEPAVRRDPALEDQAVGQASVNDKFLDAEPVHDGARAHHGSPARSKRPRRSCVCVQPHVVPPAGTTRLDGKFLWLGNQRYLQYPLPITAASHGINSMRALLVALHALAPPPHGRRQVPQRTQQPLPVGVVGVRREPRLGAAPVAVAHAAEEELGGARSGEEGRKPADP
mmetsp:Transcript_39833/g.106322  ORF Transcript_39833/g.106322 Transcript_39833/m.106322 type:complete len:284 (+) Transcript_39833:474-1325(+)